MSLKEIISFLLQCYGRHSTWFEDQRNSLADPILGPQLNRCLQAGQFIVLVGCMAFLCFYCKYTLKLVAPTCAGPKILYVPETVLSQRYSTFQRLRLSPKHFFLFRSAITNNRSNTHFPLHWKHVLSFSMCSRSVWHCSHEPHG